MNGIILKICGTKLSVLLQCYKEAPGPHQSHITQANFKRNIVRIVCSIQTLVSYVYENENSNIRLKILKESFFSIFRNFKKCMYLFSIAWIYPNLIIGVYLLYRAAALTVFFIVVCPDHANKLTILSSSALEKAAQRMPNRFWTIKTNLYWNCSHSWSIGNLCS